MGRNSSTSYPVGPSSHPLNKVEVARCLSKRSEVGVGRDFAHLCHFSAPDQMGHGSCYLFEYKDSDVEWVPLSPTTGNEDVVAPTFTICALRCRESSKRHRFTTSTDRLNLVSKHNACMIKVKNATTRQILYAVHCMSTRLRFEAVSFPVS